MIVIVADNGGDLDDLLGADGLQAPAPPDLRVTPAVSYTAAASALDAIRAGLSRATRTTSSHVGLVAEVTHIISVAGAAQVHWARGLEEHGLASALQVERPRPSHRRHLERAAALAAHRRAAIDVVIDTETALHQDYYNLRQRVYARTRPPHRVPPQLLRAPSVNVAETEAADSNSDSLLSSDAETVCGCGTCAACKGVEETEQCRDHKRARTSFNSK